MANNIIKLCMKALMVFLTFEWKEGGGGWNWEVSSDIWWIMLKGATNTIFDVERWNQPSA